MKNLTLDAMGAVSAADRGPSVPALPAVRESQLDDPGLLESLVAHRTAMNPTLKVETAMAAMKNGHANFGAVIENGKVLGQVSRHAVDEKLGGRFGFALYGNAVIREFVTEPSLRISTRDPIADVMAALNQRSGETFYDDVMLVDPEGTFVGFIYTRTLVCVQHELLLQKIGNLAASTESLNRVNRELAETYKGLVDASRRAGMAEIATGVLHNVGNVLNSLNVSASVITSGLRQSKGDSILRVAAVLREQGANLADFLTNDPKGRRIPDLIESLGKHAISERDRLLAEIGSLQQNVDHIKEIVTMQQAYATMVPVVEPHDPTGLMEDALRMNAGAFERHGVIVRREFQAGLVVLAEKSKVLQILLNLIRNAKYACDDGGNPEKIITLRVAAAGEGRVQLEVADNGIGISPENLTRIFRHGFTTRAKGHGFGLHSAANAAREMNGSLHVHSEGPGRGAVFTLELPAASAPAETTDSSEAVAA